MNIYETSLLSSDSGFDLKDQTMSVKLPKADIYKIKYEDKYNRQLLAAGEPEKVIKTLKKAGYKIVIEN
jgi:hypothetical protein